MRYSKSRLSLSAALCVMAAHHAWADTMRCGNRLIVDGESMAAVRAYCGRPTLVSHSVMVSATTVRVGGRTLNQSHTAGTEVPVETWTYNRGPNKLMMSIRFVNGTVAAIRTLHEYGYLPFRADG